MKTILSILTLLVILNTLCIAQRNSLYQEMMRFSNVLNHVRTNYVEETRPDDLMDAAINGVLTSLDPHTVYLNPAHFHRFTAIMDGTAYGIGIAFEIIEGLPTVISVVPGGPAANKNIHTGDILVKVNDEFVSNKTEPELRLLLSGDKGSEVKLTLKKFLNEEEFAVHIERDEIPLRSINYYFLLKSIFGYVKIDQFSKTVPDELENVLTKLDKMGMACLILDLRGNAGGSLQSAVNLVDMFIAEGKLIMSTKGRKADANETYYASDEDKQPDYPMIVLIDRGSASASEIVAGALQEHDRALIVGTNSFGKGLVQGTFLLENGGAILMTIARYYTPTGRLIQREYKGESFEKYYREIFDTDSSNYTERPQFKTLGGRTIYGGGGIIPDVFIENPSQPSTWNEIEESKLMFSFAGEFVKKHLVELRNFENSNEYAEQFSVHDSTLGNFLNKLDSSGIDVSTKNKDEEFLKLALKSEIAAQFWNKKAAFFIRLNRDDQLKKAIESYPHIRQMLHSKAN